MKKIEFNYKVDINQINKSIQIQQKIKTDDSLTLPLIENKKDTQQIISNQSIEKLKTIRTTLSHGDKIEQQQEIITNYPAGSIKKTESDTMS